jgi:adenine-specific DNA-methyltransferase
MAKGKIEVAALRHQDKRRNIPTAELEPVMDEADKRARTLRYPRNTDLDPQLVWRGKDEQDWSDLIVQAPPLYIQEKIHPKVLVDDLLRQSRERREETSPPMPDLFADFNGLPDKEARTEFYQHNSNWSNRMILGDSLSVMASLAEREGLRGKVQCIYLDPPYGIRFNSNFQWSTTTRDVKDGSKDHITREPEQVKAFRDTWRDGIHSYLTYLRDRLTVARDLLHETGSIFVQIGDENMHLVRTLMDEVFGPNNFVSVITAAKTTGAGSPAIGTNVLASVNDFIVWYARNLEAVKYRQIYTARVFGEEGASQYTFLESSDASVFRKMTKVEMETRNLPKEWKIAAHGDMTSQTGADTTRVPITFNGRTVVPEKGGWKTNAEGTRRLGRAMRFVFIGNTIRYRRRFDDFSAYPINNYWSEFRTSGFADTKTYVVQTNPGLISRCIQMSTDPGDLVLDPTCGSGTTAYVAEQWGRRWITIDTSRVALALARARIMGARYPYYLLADSPEGQRKEGEVTRTPPKEGPTHGDIRQGFVYERVPHITLKSIANNAEIDVIYERWQEALGPLRSRLNTALGQSWEEWEIPREAESKWPAEASKLHAEWWAARIARQREIDASIAAKGEPEYLYDKPYPDPSRIRVAGPFTVESLSPHRALAVDADDSLIDHLAEDGSEWGDPSTGSGPDFAQMVLDNLKIAGVQQAHKENRITFTSLVPWPGELIGGEGRYMEGGQEARSAGGATGQATGIERRAAIFLGPEFGTVARADLVAAAREAADARFDVVIACAFNFDAHSAEFDRLGRIPILKARINPDLHMADALKTTASGNLFVVFGEPDIEIEELGKAEGGADQIQVTIKGVDVFHPQSGEIESGGPDTIALWFIDTDYNEESFFVRHAYFLGAATDPYKALKMTLKAEIDEEAWETLRSATSRPFPKPKSGRIAVKVINHLGDEVMKVFSVR